jgi:hypothetical protein
MKQGRLRTMRWHWKVRFCRHDRYGVDMEHDDGAPFALCKRCHSEVEIPDV